MGIPVQDAAGRVSATPHPNDQATISKELFLKLPSLRPLSTPFLLVGHRSRQHAKDTRPWRPEHAQPCLLFAVMLSWVASSGGQRAGPAGQRGAQTHSLLSSLAVLTGKKWPGFPQTASSVQDTLQWVCLQFSNKTNRGPQWLYFKKYFLWVDWQ